MCLARLAELFLKYTIHAIIVLVVLSFFMGAAAGLALMYAL